MYSMHNKLRFILITVCFVLSISACRPVIPIDDPDMVMEDLNTALAKYNQIALGMSREVVAQILGTQGEDIINSSENPTAKAMPEGTFLRYKVNGFDIGATFNQGQLIIKRFSWDKYLDRPKTDALTTTEKYEQVKIGMTYAEVVDILGSPGLITMINDTPRRGLNLSGTGIDIKVDVSTTDYKTESYNWWPEEDENERLASGMLITFAQDAVTMKSYDGNYVTDD